MVFVAVPVLFVKLLTERHFKVRQLKMFLKVFRPELC